jgi:long-subunit fatty acid transport protein
MKKIFLTLTFLTTFLTFSQSIGYDAFGLLISKEEINGTARFTGMSGAFGALGGNISAGEINPAGLTVFKNSEATISLQNTDKGLDLTYFNNRKNFTDNILSLSQAGGVLIFETNSKFWSKAALGFNYTLVNNFDNSYLIEGNSGLSEFNVDPFLNFDNDATNDVFYNNVDKQIILNSTTGSNSKGSFSFAMQYDKTISYGISVLFHSVDFFQHIQYKEFNNDGLGNSLDAVLNQDLSITGDGIGINFGILAKPNPNLRLGVAYQTPIWYNFTEEFHEDTTIYLSNTTDVYNENPENSIYDYKIKTIGKVTGSIAYVFGKQGLISLDYTRKAYNNIKIKPLAEFPVENDNIKQELNATNALRIGGEYRYKNLSLRAGFRTEDNPIKSISSKNEGYSFGLGIKLSQNTKLDVSYANSTSNDNYSFIQKNDINLDLNQSKINATITIGL